MKEKVHSLIKGGNRKRKWGRVGDRDRKLQMILTKIKRDFPGLKDIYL